MKQITALLLCLLLLGGLSAAAEPFPIWGDAMPVEPEAADYSFKKAFDPADFVPTLTFYPAEDPDAAKGSVIVCSGGGDRARTNDKEGIPACEYLNSIGYNAFLLDYRVQPWRSADATLDVQRAVRWVRHNAAALGLGAPENIALMGFSAGAMHCYGEAIAFSGSITPDTVYPDYVCDEVDVESADVRAVACVYAAGMPHDTKGADVDIKAPIMLLDEGDPNAPGQLPAFFFAGGSGHFASGFCVAAYQTLNPLTDCELHMYAGIKGPFGLGVEYDGADQMRDQLEAFLNYSFGGQGRG